MNIFIIYFFFNTKGKKSSCFISDGLIKIYVNKNVIVEKVKCFGKVAARISNLDDCCCVLNIAFGELGFTYQCRVLAKKYDING